MVFAGVLKAAVSVVFKAGDFEAIARALSRFFNSFGPFRLRLAIAV